MAEATVKEIKEFFELSAKDFMAEWRNLTEQDKNDLKNGIGDGTLTY